MFGWRSISTLHTLKHKVRRKVFSMKLFGLVVAEILEVLARLAFITIGVGGILLCSTSISN